jgi:hypothetical protein
MAKVRLEWDDSWVPLGTMRHTILRAWHWRYAYGKGFAKELAKQQRGRCALGQHKLGKNFHVDHIKPVRHYAYDLSLPLEKAAELCHARRNLRAVCARCDWARNRRRKTLPVRKATNG